MVSDFINLATLLGETLQKKSLKLATAESCTGGLVSAAITDIPGSSAWFDRGFITYSNASKQEMLDVRTDTIKRYSAVSDETVKEMAQGALKYSHADISIAITGIAGPTGGTPETPIGTVFFAWTSRNKPIKTIRKQFRGDRESVRYQAVAFVLEELMTYIESSK